VRVACPLQLLPVIGGARKKMGTLKRIPGFFGGKSQGGKSTKSWKGETEETTNERLTLSGGGEPLEVSPESVRREKERKKSGRSEAGGVRRRKKLKDWQRVANAVRTGQREKSTQAGFEGGLRG